MHTPREYRLVLYILEFEGEFPGVGCSTHGSVVNCYPVQVTTDGKYIIRLSAYERCIYIYQYYAALKDLHKNFDICCLSKRTGGLCSPQSKLNY